MCVDPDDQNWELLCEEIGWPKPAVRLPRRSPPVVGGAQFTWKQSFYAICKAVNNVGGTMHSAGRGDYYLWLAAKDDPQKRQNQLLMERLVYLWWRSLDQPFTRASICGSWRRNTGRFPFGHLPKRGKPMVK